nr:unnamed protein product [Brassica rapa]
MASHNSVIHGFILNLLADNSETATDDTDPAVYSETIVECSWDQDEKVWVRESGWINQRQMISTLRESFCVELSVEDGKDSVTFLVFDTELSKLNKMKAPPYLWRRNHYRLPPLGIPSAMPSKLMKQNFQAWLRKRRLANAPVNDWSESSKPSTPLSFHVFSLF